MREHPSGPRPTTANMNLGDGNGMHTVPQKRPISKGEIMSFLNEYWQIILAVVAAATGAGAMLIRHEGRLGDHRRRLEGLEQSREDAIHYQRETVERLARAEAIFEHHAELLKQIVENTRK